nr:tetratricopeptide repeat protein [Actinomadura soli]
MLGEDHPHTLNTAAALVVSLVRLDDLERARDLGEDTLFRRRRVLGDDHGRTLDSANNLVVVLHMLGEDRLADQWLEWIKERRH